MDNLILIVVSGLSQGAIYALMALGMTIIYRSTTVLNFAHGESFMLGAFIALLFINDGLPYLLAIVLSLAVAFIVGVLIERIAMRSLVHAEHIVLVFATVAVSFILKGAVRYFSVDQRGMPPLISGSIRAGPATVNPQHLLTATALLLVAVAFSYVFLRTRAGRIVRASTQSLRGAALVGIDVSRVFAVMWGVGSMVAALAGILAAPTLLVGPDLGSRPLILGFAAMALGGFGSFAGAVAGGLMLGLLEQLASFYVSTTLGDAVGFLAILVVLLVRPRGLLGATE